MNERNSVGRMRAEMMKERGLALPMLKKIESQFPGRPLKQWEVLVARLPLKDLTGVRSDGADKRSYLSRGLEMLRTLERLGIRLWALSRFGQDDMAALVTHWTRENTLHSTIQNKATVLRRFLVWIDKIDAVEALDAVMKTTSLAQRSFTATASKIVHSAEFPRDELFARAARLDAMYSAQVMICFLYGVYPAEAILLEPNESDLGDRLLVFRPANDVRSRSIAIRTPEQRAALDNAKVIASRYARGRLTWPRLSPDDALARFKRFAKEIGLTAEGYFGTTPRDLRHLFARYQYMLLTGHLCAIEGGLAVDPKLDDDARKTLMQELGLGRVELVGRYIGSPRAARAANEKQQKALYDRFQELYVREALATSGITRLRLVGKVAAGAVDPRADTLCCYEGTLRGGDADCTVITQLLVVVVGGPCVLVPLDGNLLCRSDGLDVF